jgi:hypothetical protein
MGDAYAQLISDRDLLMLQVHALSAVDVPEIAAATRRGIERMITLIQERTGASDAAVQQFMAYGQLCHLIVAAGLTDLADGQRHATALGEGADRRYGPPGSRAREATRLRVSLLTLPTPAQPGQRVHPQPGDKS